MRNRIFFATLLAFVWMGVAGAASVWEIPNMTASPQIDGVATPGEWDSAFRVIGAGKSVDSRFAEISLAWDKENLYVCTRSETASDFGRKYARYGTYSHGRFRRTVVRSAQRTAQCR